MSKNNSAQKVLKINKAETNELKEFIEKKKIQNKALKKIIDSMDEVKQSKK